MVNAWSLLYDEVGMKEYSCSDVDKFSSTKQQNSISYIDQLTSKKKTDTINIGKL